MRERVRRPAQTVSNWVMGEMMRLLNERVWGPTKPFPASYLARLLKLVDNGTKWHCSKRVFVDVQR